MSYSTTIFYHPHSKWPAQSAVDHEIQLYKAEADSATATQMRYMSPDFSHSLDPAMFDPFHRIDHESAFNQPRGYPLPSQNFYSEDRTYDGLPLLPSSAVAETHVGGYFPPQVEVDPFYNPNLPPVQNVLDSTGRIKSRARSMKKIEGKQPTFLTKLYSILDQEEYKDIIRWDETGETIIIERPQELAENVLPLVYRQSRFASFSRQLNIYGWMRKVSLRHTDRGILDPDASTWSHPLLRRSSTRAELLAFKRRVPPRPSQAKKTSQRTRMLSPFSCSEGSIHSPPDAYRHLMGDSDENQANLDIQNSPESSDLELEPEDEQVHVSFNPYLHYTSKMFQLSSQPRQFQIEDTNPVPMSAPPQLTTFAKLATPQTIQQHLRTRSVQEASPSPIDREAPHGSQDEKQTNETSERFRPFDNSLEESPLALRGVANLYTTGFNFPAAGFEHTDNGPASLPNGFGGSFLFHHPSLPAGLSISPPSFSSLPEPDPAFPPATVSPGVYQSGFSPPIHPRPYHYSSRPISPQFTAVQTTSSITESLTSSSVVTPSTPNAISMTKTERRASVGSKSPYSSRIRFTPLQSLTLTGGNIKVIDKETRRGSNPDERDIVRCSRGLIVDEDAVKKDVTEDDGLPSGGLLKKEQDPFASVLPGPVGDPDGMDPSNE